MPAVLNSAPTQLMRGDCAAVCIYQFPFLIPDKNKHVVSDQTYNCPQNKNDQRAVDDMESED